MKINNTQVLKILFILSTVLGIVWVLHEAPWKGYITYKNSTVGFNLEPSPAWSPPEGPVYEQFQRVFGDDELCPDLPSELPPDVKFRSVLWGEALAFNMISLFWGIAIIISALSFVIQPNKLDFVIHFVRWIAAGLTIGIGACTLLWLVIGGWMAPYSYYFFFTCVGFLFGIYKGWTRWRKEEKAGNSDIEVP